MDWRNRIVRLSTTEIKSILCSKQKSDLALPLRQALDDLGSESAIAQGLPGPITSADKALTSDNVCYIKFVDNVGVGILKVGKRQLFVAPPNGGGLMRIEPLCVLDFFVRSQRSGNGKELFDCMLSREDMSPAMLAYDRPSHKLLSFLRRHYRLYSYVPQTINYVVFDDFYEKRPQSRPNSSSAPPTKIEPKLQTPIFGFSTEPDRTDFRIRRSQLNT